VIVHCVMRPSRHLRMQGKFDGHEAQVMNLCRTLEMWYIFLGTMPVALQNSFLCTSRCHHAK
jgi:hypothetical protein